MGLKVIFLFNLLLAWSSPLLAQQTIFATSSTPCISNINDIQSNLRIKNIVQSLGGIEKLQGQWMLKVGPMQVTMDFFCNPAGLFSVSKNGKPLGNISICESEKPNTLKLVGAKTVLVQKGSEDNSLRVAEVSKKATKASGKFYSFFKKSDRSIEDIVSNQTWDRSLAYNPPQRSSKIRGSQ